VKLSPCLELVIQNNWIVPGLLNKNIFANLIGQLSILLVSLVATKFIFSDLGPEILGVVYFASILGVTLSATLDKGLYSLTVLEVSRNYRKDNIYLTLFIQSWSVIILFLFLTLSLIVYLVVPFLVDSWLNIETLDRNETVYLIRFLSVVALLNFPISFYSSLIRGTQKMVVNNVVDFSSSLFVQLGIVLILFRSGSVMEVSFWMALGALLKLLTYQLLCGRFFSLIALLPKWSKAPVVNNFSFLKDMSVISLMSLLLRQFDKLVISKIMMVSDVGFYNFLFIGLQKGTILTNSVATAIYPKFCESKEEEKIKDVFNLYDFYHECICVFTVPIFLFAPWFYLEILGFVFNEELAEYLFIPLCFLSAGFYFNGTLGIPYRLALAFGETKLAVRQDYIGALIFFPLTIILVDTYGLPGASLGWLLYFLLGYVTFVPFFYERVLNRKAREYYWLVTRILVLAVLVFGSSYHWFVFESSRNPVTLVIAYCFTTLIFGLLGLLLLSKDSRKTIFLYIKHSLSRYMSNLGAQ